MRANIVRHWLRRWKTLVPKKEQVQNAKETLLLDGYHRDYVFNVCLSLKCYGEYVGHDLAVKPPTQDKSRVPRFLTESEVQNFLFGIDSIRDRALFTTLAYTGLRVFELCNLRPEDVDYEARIVTVQNGKGGKSAEVPISRLALDAVSVYLGAGLRSEASPWLFHGPNGAQLSTNRVRVLARRYGHAAGIKKAVSPHMFRHALATNLLAKGCPLPFVQRQLRHSRIETTMRYLHLSDAMLRNAYDQFTPDY